MFWTDWGDSRAGIYRSDMDGSLAGCIVSEGVRWPNGISVDDHQTLPVIVLSPR